MLFFEGDLTFASIGVGLNEEHITVGDADAGTRTTRVSQLIRTVRAGERAKTRSRTALA